MTRNLCLFDLDDTLLPLDSDHAWGNFMVSLGWVDEVEFRRRNDEFFAQYQAGQLHIYDYIAFASQPLRARSALELNAAQGQFMAEVITPKITPEARALVATHQAQGDLVALVTATNDFVTAPIATAFGIAHLLAVRLQRDASGNMTGSIEGTPSYREGKVLRVNQWLAEQGAKLQDFSRISVYSDSLNDLPLLEVATDPVATNPSAALETLARERQWRILKLFT
jgi:HAD superfamily hydrolase (TIGR01490 family)